MNSKKCHGALGREGNDRRLGMEPGDRLSGKMETDLRTVGKEAPFMTRWVRGNLTVYPFDFALGGMHRRRIRGPL